jgi:hypothetical protein
MGQSDGRARNGESMDRLARSGTLLCDSDLEKQRDNYATDSTGCVIARGTGRRESDSANIIFWGSRWSTPATLPPESGSLVEFMEAVMSDVAHGYWLLGKL